MSTTKAINLQKHVWEGWRVGDFIDSLAPELAQALCLEAGTRRMV